MYQDSISQYLVNNSDILCQSYFPLPQTDGSIFEEENQPQVPSLFQQGTYKSGWSISQEGLRRRITNNSFKAPLNIFRNIIIAELDCENDIKNVKTVTEKKNLSAFPKLLFLIEKWGMKKNVFQKWEKQQKLYLKTLTNMDERMKEEIKSIIKRMNDALEANGWKKAIRLYWGEEVKHKAKMQNSIREIGTLRNSKMMKNH